MSTAESYIDSILDTQPVATESSTGLVDLEPGVSSAEPFKEEGYTGNIDYRIRQLSYSSLLTLHSCPRKFELYKKRTTHRTEETEKQSITFSFGHVVGEAIQLALQKATLSEVILNTFLNWKPDLFASDTKGSKSVWEAILAAQRFYALLDSGFLSEYELLYVNGKPACELSFAINFPDGFRYRGFVDAVLRHRISGEILVLECKTTGSTAVNPATFKNSAQAIGYSVVLDHIAPDISSYDVQYLVYQTKTREYLPLKFQKTYLQRSLWLRELLLDIETIKMYEEAGVYPMHGESCVSFGSDCEYLQSCTLSNSFLVKRATEADLDKTEYQINVGFMDLVETQLSKTAQETSHETL